MLEKLPPRKEFFFTPERLIKSATLTKALPKWTGWSRSGNAELQLWRPPQPAFGKISGLILLTLRGMLILRLKLKDRFGFLTAASRFWMRKKASNHSPKLSGIKPINT